MSKLFQLVSFFLMSFILNATSLAQEYDIVIRGGKVLDGAGNPWVKADVGIKNGKFTQIGLVKGLGKREIDASGHFVSPGWIDMMDQSGHVLMTHPRAENKLSMGVTTAIGGEGGTPVDTNEIRDYFTKLETQGIGINFGTYYNIGQPREAIYGEGDGDASPAQIIEMQAMVREAMEAGVMGLSSALIYPPNAYINTETIVSLVQASAPYGGIYASHIRSESRELVKAIEEVINISEKGGVRAEIFHLKNAFAPNWGKEVHKAIDVVRAARNRGVDIAADQYPYVAGGTGLDATMPQWIFAKGIAQALEDIMKPEVRDRMKIDIFDPAQDSLVASSGGWENVVLANSHLNEYARFHNMNFQYIGKELGLDPADVSWDIFVKAANLTNEAGEPDGKRAMALFFMMSEEDVKTFMAEPWVSIGSDAGAASNFGQIDGLGLPHPRSYGTFPRIIAKYVREDEVLTLPDAIRKMTSWPAERMRMNDRGVIREGMWADVVIFDYDNIEDTATWEKPVETPKGIPYVLVNGEVVIDNGKHTGALPGHVIYGSGRAN
ncbi:MAG: N-acyl-D-amino-acid deacylase family protein [Sphingomonadales bacterium]